MWTKSSYCDTVSCLEVSFEKSSYSGSQGGNCVEVGFTKSTYSNPSGNCVEVGFNKSTYSNNNGACVEVGSCGCPDTVFIRDSKDQQGPILGVSIEAWRAFAAGVKADEFVG